MPPYVSADPFATSHISHRDLLQDFDALVAGDHMSFAVLLTRIAEIDERKLYLSEGYSSMNAFLVRRMHLPTQDAAYKRLTAARAARKYPGILVALADGRLHMTAVLMLAPHLTSANAHDLVAAAVDKTCFELQIVLVERFPRPDLPERICTIAVPAPPLMSAGPADLLAAKRVETTIPNSQALGHAELAAQRVEAPRSRVTPLAPKRFGYQFTADEETHELYEYARTLLSHEVPTGEMAQVFKSVLRLAVGQLDKRKFAATSRPGRSRGSVDPRCIPASVKRAVCERDGGRCAFVSESGKRCGSCWRLEFDHIEPVSRGGVSTVENLRLVCRAHNQHAADRVLGAEFMNDKRASAGACGRPTRAAT